MVGEGKSSRKPDYFTRIGQLFDEFPTFFIVGVDNVGSKQMQEIRHAMRDEAVILMGKNTMVRKFIRDHSSQNPSIANLLPHIVQNVGFVFTKGNLSDVREKLLENRKATPAKAGSIAPCDVVLPPQNTGLGPEKTAFFQSLKIPTRITRGSIEILNEVHLIRAGERVGASEAALLSLLRATPFSYGLTIHQVYDHGSIYSPQVLDFSPTSLRSSLNQGIRDVAAVSMAINYPSTASVPHSLATGLLDMMGVAAVTGLNFKYAASAAPAAAAAVAAEQEVESDDDMGFGIFD